MSKASTVLLLIILAGCQAGGGGTTSSSTTGGTTGGGTSGGSSGGTSAVSAAWSFPTSTSSVQYAFQGLPYSNTIASGFSCGGVSFTFSSPTPSWISASCNNGNVIVSGTPTEASATYAPLTVSYTNGTASGSASFTLIVKGDLLRAFQWHLENNGTSFFSHLTGTSDEDMDVSAAWQVGEFGEDIAVAVSDTGVDTTHPDLSINFLSSLHRNYYNGSSAAGWVGTPSHYGEAHGTAVSGIIGAVGWNNVGGTGIAPKVRIAGFQFLSSNQTSAMYVHQATGPFDVFNYSYGTGLNTDIDDDPLFIEQLRTSVTTGRSGHGQIYVKAAGNEYDEYCNTSGLKCAPQNANMPAENNSPFMIVMGSTNATSTKSSYANAGSNIWVSAPGGEYGDSRPAIVTTDLTSCSQGFSTATSGPYVYNKFERFSSSDTTFTTYNPNCDYTSVMNGTSSATPMAAGVVALMLGANPNLGWRDVKHILAVTADRVNPTQGVTTHPGGATLDLAGHTYEQGWVQNAAGHYYNNWYGFGRINAAAAVAMAKDPGYVALPTWFESNPDYDRAGHGESGLTSAIPDGSATGVSRTLNINYGAGKIVESVQVRVSVTHNKSGQVGVELTSPDGTKSILLNINNALIYPVDGTTTPDKDLALTLTTHAFYGENASGNWQIKLIDGSADGTAGTLTDWAINLIGH